MAKKRRIRYHAVLLRWSRRRLPFSSIHCHSSDPTVRPRYGSVVAMEKCPSSSFCSNYSPKFAAKPWSSPARLHCTKDGASVVRLIRGHYTALLASHDRLAACPSIA